MTSAAPRPARRPHGGGAPGEGRRADVVVVGSVNVDLTVAVAAHPAPGETVIGRDLVVRPGGKGANQAVAAARLGSRVVLIGSVGTDDHADVAVAGLREAGVELAVARHPGPTGVALVTVADGGENTVVVVPGANDRTDADAVSVHAATVAAAGVVVVQGEIPRAGVERAAAAARGRLVVNLAPVVPVDSAVLRRADPLVVNEVEAAQALALLGGAVPGGAVRRAAGPGADADGAGGLAVSPVADEGRVAVALLAAGVRSVVITLGCRGALVARSAGLTRLPAARVGAVDTTGAGDAFVGALAHRLAAGEALVEAARFAGAVAAYAVGRPGAQSSCPWRGDPLPDVAGAVRA